MTSLHNELLDAAHRDFHGLLWALAQPVRRALDLLPQDRWDEQFGATWTNPTRYDVAEACRLAEECAARVEWVRLGDLYTCGRLINHHRSAGDVERRLAYAGAKLLELAEIAIDDGSSGPEGKPRAQGVDLWIHIASVSQVTSLALAGASAILEHPYHSWRQAAVHTTYVTRCEDLAVEVLKGVLQTLKPHTPTPEELARAPEPAQVAWDLVSSRCEPLPGLGDALEVMAWLDLDAHVHVERAVGWRCQPQILHEVGQILRTR